MTVAFTRLERERPGQAYARLRESASDGGVKVLTQLESRLDIQLDMLLRDSSAELTGRQLAHHVAAAGLLAKLMGGTPHDQLASYGAALHVAKVLQQDFEYNSQDKGTWTRSWQALQQHGHSDPLRSLTELALVPQRAKAFDVLPRDVALEQFPELGGAYAALDAVARIAPKSPAGDVIVGRSRDQLLAGMRRGFLHPSHKHLAAPTIRASLARFMEVPAFTQGTQKAVTLPKAQKTPSPSDSPSLEAAAQKVARPRALRR